jgi:fumarate reductase flavoprotein subunit
MTIIRETNKEFEVSVQVLIIGAGACGCTAALAAHEAGAEVMILERDDSPRGNTSLSGGQIPAAGTKLQIAAGIDDPPEILFEDLINKAKGQNDAELARHIAEQSARTIDWLMDSHDMPLSLVDDFLYPGHQRHHMHGSPSRFGAELLTVFVDAVQKSGIDIALRAPVQDLYANEDGRVIGVRIARSDGTFEDVGCDTLILACNGYGGSPEMMKKYIPEMVDAHYHGHAGNKGDAALWGAELGAELMDMESFQGHGAVTEPHKIHLGWPSISEGGFQVNSEGARFSNENHGYSEQALNVIRQPGHVAWTIFDDRCHDIAMQFHSHQECQKEGAIKVAKNAAEIAAIVGCDEAAIAATLRETEEIVGGKEDPFGRDFKGNAVLAAPYRVAKVTGALFHTQGGVAVDKSGRVLRADGSSLPNLFAGGGAARGLSGPSDWGYLSGSGLLMATNLGRLAGEAAAAQVLAG